MFHSITWEDGNFDRTASVLSFYTRAARASYPLQSAQRVESITHDEMKKHVRDGRAQRLVLWDKNDPTKFVFQV